MRIFSKYKSVNEQKTLFKLSVEMKRERVLLLNVMDDCMLVIEVEKVKGKCPVYRKGDKIVTDGPRIILEKTDALCIHALGSLLPYMVALREGADPKKLGLSKKGKYAYIQCLDPGEPYTDGGTVIFKCLNEKREES